MTSKIQFRRDTAANWTATDPILSQGEPGLETDTGKVKYGDGTTVWSALAYSSSGDLVTTFDDGVNGNTWRFVTVSGSKSFDYITPGHKYIVIQNTQVLTDTTTYTTDLAAFDTDLLDLAVTNNSNIYIYVNNDWNSRLQVDVTNNGSTYTFTTRFGGTYSTASGDEVTIEYWCRGTQYLDQGWSNWTLLPYNTSVSTNTLLINNNDWQGNDINTWLTTNDDKHIITFNDISGEDIRTVTGVTVADGIYTVTFDGDPRAVTAPSVKSFTTTPTNSAIESDTLTISREAHPELRNIMNTYQQQDIQERLITGVSNGYNMTVTIPGMNNGDPIRASWSGQKDSRDNYVIYLEGYYDWTSTTNITVHFEDKGTEFELDIYIDDANWAGYNDGYKWFDWREDLGETFVDVQGNGVQGGRFMVYYKIYNLEDNQLDYNTMVMDWNNNENGPYVNPRDINGNSPYDYGNDGNGGNYPMNDFDERGIYFASWWGGYGDSKNLKVRIMYKFEVVIGEDNTAPNTWFDC